MSSHTVRSVRIRSFSGPYFPAFGLTERYGVSLRIQFECGKIRTDKYLKRTLSMQCMAILTNTFLVFYILLFCSPKGSWNKLQNLRIWENISHIALGNHCVKSTRIVLVRMPENAGRNNSGYRHFLRSDRAITSSDI